MIPLFYGCRACLETGQNQLPRNFVSMDWNRVLTTHTQQTTHMAQAAPYDGANPGSEADANGNDEGLIMNFDGIIKVYLRYPQPVEEPWAPHWMANAPTEKPTRFKRKILVSVDEDETQKLSVKCDNLQDLIDTREKVAHEYFTENQKYIDYLLNKDTPIGVTVVTPLESIEYDLDQWDVIYQMIQATRFKAAEQHADLTSMKAAEMAFLQKELDKHRDKESDDWFLQNFNDWDGIYDPDDD